MDRDDLLEAWWSQVVYHGSLKGVGNSHNAFNIDVRESFSRLIEEAKRTENLIERELPQLAQLTSASSPEKNAQTFAQLESYARARQLLRCCIGNQYGLRWTRCFTISADVN